MVLDLVKIIIQSLQWILRRFSGFFFGIFAVFQ